MNIVSIVLLLGTRYSVLVRNAIATSMRFVISEYEYLKCISSDLHCCQNWASVTLTLSLRMYICVELLVKPEILTSFIYMDVRLATLEAVSFYLLHNVSTLNQCRKLSCGTVVYKHFASYQGYPIYRWGLTLSVPN
jgi:hypothetical protein